MYGCMWRTADPLENTGRLSLHVFVLWPFCDWPVVSADCLPKLPWRGKALEGMDGNRQSDRKKRARLRWSHDVSLYAASGTTTLSHAVLFSPLSFQNLKYAITETCRNVPSVREACLLCFSSDYGTGRSSKLDLPNMVSVFKCAVNMS